MIIITIMNNDKLIKMVSTVGNIAMITSIVCTVGYEVIRLISTKINKDSYNQGKSDGYRDYGKQWD